MSEVTVKELANTVGIPPDRLLSQLKEAGIVLSGTDDLVSDDAKKVLLDHLRSGKPMATKAASNGESTTEDTEQSPRKITLRRKSVGELKLPGSRGRTKTVNVEVRKKRTYVKRSVIEAVEDEKRKEESKQEEALPAEETATKVEGQEQVLPETIEVASEEKVVSDQEEQQAVTPEGEIAEVTSEPEAVETAEVAVETKEVASESTVQKEAPPVTEEKVAETTRRQDAPKKETAKRGRGERQRFDKYEREERAELHIPEGKGAKRKKKSRAASAPSISLSAQHGFEKPTAPVVREVTIPETITVGELSQKISVKAAEVIKVLMHLGTMATINQVLDQDTAVLVVEELGHVAKPISDTAIEEAVVRTELAGEKEIRPPVVTIMGHVDHGKTSLLDYIRKTRVAAGEAGGITQHIGAYFVKTDHGGITFLDTPGHAAFTAMRARGAQVTDIVVLVVAADDGAMPQTIEAVQHAKAANVPLIVAVNKIDKENADPDRVKGDLANHDVIPEDWGGDTQFVAVSALTGEGVDVLLEAIALQAEILELKAVSEGSGKGFIIESRLDKGRGPVATVLVQEGSLAQGDMLLAGQEYGRVRALFDEHGQSVKQVGPSMAVEVLGLSGTPQAGDEVQVVEDERTAREIAELRQSRSRERKFARQQAAKLDQMFSKMESGERQILNLIIKADVQGSVEALQDALTKLANDEVAVNVVAAGTGGINESEVNLALASDAIIIGFNVRADSSAKQLAQREDVEIRYYSVVYDAIDQVKQALTGMLQPKFQENLVGLAEVRDVFRSSKLGSIAGCMVIEGTVYRNKPIRVLRDNVVIYEGELESLRRFKEDVAEVRSGTECGIGVKNYNDVKSGDQIEVYDRVEIAPSI
ncbi:MAG TPA: translation initiation factor IF-2 [Gammaproteobacteria bacterium]|nr:translation initiation factor IF-2 [Gammaproteobacteria bacterium]